MSVVVCRAWTPNKRGKRCGLPVDDGELIMCTKHARAERERRRLEERIEYGGHTIARNWRANDGSLRDDWYLYVAEHMQIVGPTHSVVARHLRIEIDACNEEQFPGCAVYRMPVVPPGEINWERFKLSRGEFHT